MRKITYAERLTAVETELKGLRADVVEMKGDIKALLEDNYRQKGASKVAAALWAGLLTLGGAIGGAFAAKIH